MKRFIASSFVSVLLFTQQSQAQAGNSFGSLPPFTKWYQNPLGVSPLAMHTANGLFIPAIAASAILIFTKKDSALRSKLSFYNEFGISYGYYGSKSTVYQNNTGTLFQVRKYMSLGVEFSTIHIKDAVNDTWGFGLRPFVRFLPVNNHTVHVFFQSGAGLVLFKDTYPKPSGFFGDYREGTKLNGSPRYGIGAGYHLNRQLSIEAGLWHHHFSNGDHPSYERNPGHDSNGFSVGLVYSAKKSGTKL